MSSVAIFSVANEVYVPKAVAALRSFQRWHPDFGYFLLGTESTMSRESLQLIKRYDIELIDVDEAHTFMAQGRKKDNYPVEVFYPVKGPELLAKRGFTYSIGVDGDVFAPQAFNIPQLEDILKQTRGYAARPVGTLVRTLIHKQGEQNREFDFSPRTVADVLGIKSKNILWRLKTRFVSRRYEPQAGVIYWNNSAMAELGLFEKCGYVFKQCKGCFEADQDLLTLVAEIYDIPFLKLGHPYNFGFFEDSEWPDRQLFNQLQRGDYQDIFVVHFVFAKPWLPLEKPTTTKIHFINEWRKFVRQEFGVKANDFFEDLSPIGLHVPTNQTVS